MDGVFIAYHNTERMFGFQYASLREMEECLYGSQKGLGDRIFDKCVSALEAVADRIAQCFPEQVCHVS